MNQLPIQRESFSRINPKMQLAWDSVSTGARKKCARYYQLAILEGWRAKGWTIENWTRLNEAPSLHLRYGQLYHRALEFYDHKICEGFDYESALRLSLLDLRSGCLDTWQNETTGEIITKWWDPNEGLGEKKAAENAKTLPNLFRTVVWYLERFGTDDPLKTVVLANGKPAVEMSFRFEAGFDSALTGEPILYSGHIDRLVEWTGAYWVLDRKTTKSTIEGDSSWGYFAQFNPNNQMTGYTLAGNVVLGESVKGVIIDAVQIAKGFSRYVRSITTRTEDQLSEWLKGFQFLVRETERMIELDFFPMNENACDDYGGCIFRGICNKDPKVRQIYLETDFTNTNPWDPLKIRGDV